FLRFLIDPEFSGYFGHAYIQEAEDWYVCHRWGHVRRGYTIDDLKGRMRLLGLEINVFFYFFGGPLLEIWDIFTFTVLNRLFPFSLIVGSPLMRLFNVARRGNEHDSFLLAVYAVTR
ncbi:MAG: hypothetical protein PHS37_04340, partial [Candidatus Omnitrophica bacterium]|nr:hypothetical protein [Candidatus Omnitrophota bacterium]